MSFDRLSAVAAGPAPAAVRDAGRPRKGGGVACLAACLGLLTCGPARHSNNGATVGGSINDALYRTPVGNVEVCIIEPAGLPCTTTGPSGKFEFLDVPRNSDILVRFLAAGYYPNVAHYSVRADTEFLTYLLTSEELSDLAASMANVNRDDNKGIIVFSARTGRGADAQNVEGVAVSMEPASQGDGPYYAVSNGFDKTRTSTTSVGGGAWFNIPEGTVTIRYAVSDRTCTPYYGWAGTEPGTLTVRILAGYSTYISQVCPPP